MVRMLAFVGGMLAGMLLLLVVAGVSRTPAATAAKASTAAKSAASASVPHDSGPTFSHPVDPHDGLVSADTEPDDGTQVDLQGDEVTAAVARYRFDAQGNIYETHAPHTEVPRLGTPQL